MKKWRLRENGTSIMFVSLAMLGAVAKPVWDSRSVLYEALAIESGLDLEFIQEHDDVDHAWTIRRRVKEGTVECWLRLTVRVASSTGVHALLRPRGAGAGSGPAGVPLRVDVVTATTDTADLYIRGVGHEEFEWPLGYDVDVLGAGVPTPIGWEVWVKGENRGNTPGGAKFYHQAELCSWLAWSIYILGVTVILVQTTHRDWKGSAAAHEECEDRLLKWVIGSVGGAAAGGVHEEMFLQMIFLERKSRMEAMAALRDVPYVKRIEVWKKGCALMATRLAALRQMGVSPPLVEQWMKTLRQSAPP